MLSSPALAAGYCETLKHWRCEWGAHQDLELSPRGLTHEWWRRVLHTCDSQGGSVAPFAC
jgi:hypothetical protein